MNDKPELETLDSASPATLRMNSHVIKPEHSECEHNWLDRGFIVEKCSKCGALNTTQDTINKAEDAGQPVGCPDLEVMHLSIPNKTPEQPNLKIIED